MSLNKEMDEKLVAIRQKAQAQVEQQIPEEESQGSAQSTEEQSKPMAEEAPKESKEETTEIVAKEAPEKVEEKPWYADETEEKVSTPKDEVDLSTLVSDLGLGEIKSKDDLKTKVSEIKSKLKELEDAPLAGIPDEFKEVIKATKSGADWKEMLASQIIDYTKVDPIQLFEDEFFNDAVKNPKYFTDGKFDQAKAEEALDAIPESLRGYQGKLMAQGRMNEQRQRQQELKAAAEAKLAQAEKALGSATKGLSEILPFDKYGLQFDASISSNIYQGIANSKLTKKHLGMDFEGLVKSGTDMNAIARTITLAEYGEKMLSYKTKSAKVEGKKELLDKTQNAQIKAPGVKVNPENPDQKVVPIADKLREHFKSTKVGL